MPRPRRIQTVGNYDGAYLIRRSPSDDSWQDTYVDDQRPSLNERLSGIYDDDREQDEW